MTRVLVNSVVVVYSPDVISAIGPGQTVLVTLILANNVSGYLELVTKFAAHCQELHVLFRTNVVQAVGKASVDLRGGLVEANMVTLVGHKFGPLKGVSALYVHPGYLSEKGGNRI